MNSREKLIEYFKSVFSKYSNHTCLHFNCESFKYKQLHALMCQIQEAIASYPAGPIIIKIPNSILYYAAVIASILSGRTFIPVSEKYPDSMMHHIIRTTQAALIISTDFTNPDPTYYKIEQLRHEHCDYSKVDSEKIIAILYSSGSTGLPKGVNISYSSLINRFQWMWSEFPFDKSETQLFKSNTIFVDSIWECFGAFLMGVKTLILTQDEVNDPSRFLNICEQHLVTRITLVPSYLRVLLNTHNKEMLAKQLSHVRYWIVSGEVFDTNLARKLYRICPQSTILNLYGSTELMGDVTYHVLSPESFTYSSIPIGKGIPNNDLFLLNESNEVAPINSDQSGILVIAGLNLTPGYVDPDLNKTAFKEVITGDTLYRCFITNDICTYKNGYLIYEGRADREVKVSGIKINLDYIENTIRKKDLVRNVAVIYANAQVVCILDNDDLHGKDKLIRCIKQHLSTELPPYAHPSKFLFVDNLPKTYSGKTNYSILASEINNYSRDTEQSITNTNSELLKLFREITENPELKSTDNLFENGLTSLNVIQATTAARRKLNLRLSVKQIFENPTVATLELKES